MNCSLPNANLWQRLMLLVHRRRGFIVSGDSMEPTLRDGDAVLFAPVTRPRVGDLVLVRHPYKQSVTMIKRVAGIEDGGRYSVSGDNPSASTDSRTFGTMSEQDLVGIVVCRLGRKDRRKAPRPETA